MTKLSKRIVDAAEARDKDYVIWDDELLGFGLRVFASGKRSYLIQYRSAGRSRRYTIGQHGVWTPELARKEANVQLGRVAQGDNPAEERQLDHKAMTVKELCDLYFSDLKAGLILGKGGRPKKASTIVTDTGRINRHIVPLSAKQGRVKFRRSHATIDQPQSIRSSCVTSSSAVSPSLIAKSVNRIPEIDSQNRSREFLQASLQGFSWSNRSVAPNLVRESRDTTDERAA